MDIEEEAHVDLGLARRGMSAKTAFHLTLAAIVIPVIAPLLAWVCVALKLRDEDGGWRPRLLWLAVVDTLVVAALGLLLWNTFARLRTSPTPAARPAVAEQAPAPAAPRLRIGVRMDPLVDHAPQIRTLSPDGPAAAAGVRIGDQIIAVDGEPAGNAAQIADVFAATPPGQARHLSLLRGTENVLVDVTPSTEVSVPPPLPAPPPAPRRVVQRPSLFTTYEPADNTWMSSTITAAKSLMLVLFGLAALVAVSRRRGNREIAPAASVILAMTISMLGVLFGLALLRSVHLLSAGSSLIVLILGAAAMLANSWIAMKRTATAETLPAPKGTISTTALGFFYLVASLVRIVIVMAAIVPYTRSVGVSVATVDLPSAATSATNVIPLFIISSAILGPIAEELLFRGVLLPWLRRFMTDTGATLACACVFAVGHIFYGLGVLIVLAYGVILGWARIRTGKLYAPIVIHIVINLTMALVGANR